MRAGSDNYPPENIGQARALRGRSTDAEKLFWKHLRMRQVGAGKFRRQQPIGDYIVDFICLEKNLIIELDGGQHTETKRYDDARTLWLQGKGYRVMRFWNHEVLNAPEAVLLAVLTEIDKES